LDLADESVNALGEFGRVGDEMAGAVAGLGWPAVVDVEVFVAEVSEA
jgi:hypothetical protein